MALQYLLAPTFQFVNTAGKPLSGGAYMEVYVHGTRTKYFCASDFDGTLHPFRIPLDSLGSNIVLANDTGSYDVYAYNRYGTLMMSRYNVKPGAGGGIGGTITSTDGSIDIHPTEDGVDLSVNGLDPSCLKVSADPRTTDGKFHFDTLVKEGDQAYVDNEGAIRLIKGWYHFTANVQLAWNAGARNETHQVTLYTTLSNSVIDFDISHVHTETIELSGDVSIAQDGSELVIGVSGMPTGLEASVVSMDVHAITGKDGHDKYYAGNGITISNENYIAADLDVVQEKLVAGQGVTIEGNVISAPSLVQVNSDWNATSGVAEILNKPDLDVFATKTEVNAGLAGKQNTIPDLSAIRSGATAGASAVQPSDLAAVATTGSYDDLNNRPNLTVYATKTEVNNGLATKQDTISDLSAIRAGAQAGATAVQPAALDSYATKVELNTGLSGKQDTINDLSEIRSGAAAGSTALQPSDVAEVATTGDYDDLTNKPSIPTATSDLTNDSGFITSADVPVKDVQVDGASVVNAQGVAEITMPDLSGYATTQALNTGLAGKQDTISDLSTIRSGAAAGATAVQPADLATVATTGDYDDLSNKPTIPSGAQLVPAATSADADKVLTVDSLGVPGWAIVPAQSTGLFQATYGTSTYNEVRDAVADNKIVYCNFYGRMAFLAFVSSNSYEFQYYRSNNSSSGTDSVFVYEVNSSGWTTVERAVKAGNIRYPVTQVNVNGSSAMTGTVANITIPAAPTVDQTYDASSVNAQSGVAVAQAIASIPSSSYTAGNGIDITNNVVSVDTSVVATQTDLASKQDTISDLATIRSGAQLGSTAVQPGDLATVATTGSYDDLVDKPTIPAAQVNSDWNSNSGVSQILNKPTLAAVATTGDYDDLSNKPSIPAAQVNADWNATSGVSEILNKPSIPTATSDLTNDSGFITLSDVPAQVNADWNSSSGASEILNKPTIPSGSQLVPAATSADADKVLTVDAQGTPAWASAQAPISAGNGIDITNNTVSAKVDGSTIGTNSNGELESLVTQENADWNAVSGAAEILNKPVPKTLTAGSGISITENQSTITITNTASAGPTYTAGDGIKISNQNVISKDETVLWEDTNGATSAQLSESIFNFETIKIFYAGGERYGNRPSMELAVTSSVLNNGIQISDWFINSAGTFVVMANGYYTVSQTGDELTGSYITHMWFSVPNFTYSGTGSSGVKIFKVVGIHRIASN